MSVPFSILKEVKKYKLGNPRTFHYLNQSNCYELDGIDDAKEYIATRKAMEVVGISSDEQVIPHPLCYEEDEILKYNLCIFSPPILFFLPSRMEYFVLWPQSFISETLNLQKGRRPILLFPKTKNLGSILELLPSFSCKYATSLS